MTDEYLTIKEYAESSLKIKGSKFIGHVYPVSSRDVAESKIKTLREEYYDATHHCSAFRIGLGDQAIYHYDDDGEPSGTAGKPIYQAITGAEITNTLIIVTRYFGGTKLGTGGLIRAYGETAQNTIKSATLVRRILQESLSLQTTYEDISHVMRVIDQFDASIAAQDYGEEINFTIRVRQSGMDEFKQQLIDQTAGRVILK